MIDAEVRAALVRRHVIVAEEQQAIAAGVLDHNLRVACIAYALLSGQLVQRAPVAAPVTMPIPMPTPAPPVVPVAQRARPDNLRARLGIG